jgi:2,3-bisphosphoglycerate-dependent phosphoglycerate mutase
VTARLVLVRHGESQVQVDRIVGGPTGCKGLSDLGRRQVEALRERWAARAFRADVLVSSTLPRAVETAEILSPALGGLEFEQRDELCELFPGESDAMTWEEFGARFRPEGWTYDPHAPMAPGAESWVSFQQRVARALQALAEDHAGQTVVVACHGGIVDGSMVHFLDLPVTDPRRWRVTNSSVTEWAHVADPYSEVVQADWRLERFNDAAHLEDLPAE